jgi:hypothetical protein
VSYFSFSASDAENAIMLMQPVVQSLEKRLNIPLKLVSVNFDKAANSYEIYFRYQAPLISVSAMLDHESEILAKIHEIIPQLRDVAIINDSWTTGFGFSLRNGMEELVYLTINSKENPISIAELVKLKSVFQKFQ